MSRDQRLRLERNKEIKAAYNKLKKETITGRSGRKEQKYRHLAILSMLSGKFYLSEGTISNILLLPENKQEGCKEDQTENKRHKNPS